jgi:hypothetical protein
MIFLLQNKAAGYAQEQADTRYPTRRLRRRRKLADRRPEYRAELLGSKPFR